MFAVLIAKDKAAGISLFDAKSQFKKAKCAYYAAYHDKKERWSEGKDPAYTVHNPDPDSLFGVQGYSTDPTFPFNLPLAEWAPE